MESSNSDEIESDCGMKGPCSGREGTPRRSCPPISVNSSRDSSVHSRRMGSRAPHFDASLPKPKSCQWPSRRDPGDCHQIPLNFAELLADGGMSRPSERKLPVPTPPRALNAESFLEHFSAVKDPRK